MAMDERDDRTEQLRGAPGPPAGRGLPDARLAQRGGRRRAGGLDPASSRADTSDVENLAGWLTTVVSRVVAQHPALPRAPGARTRSAPHMPDVILDRAGGTDPEHEALLADSVGRRPPRRAGHAHARPSGWPSSCTTSSPSPSTRSRRSSSARPRRRASWPAGPGGAIQGEPTVPDVDLERQREVVDAFLAAARDGDFEALLAVLDPDVVVRADQGAAARRGGRGGA